MLNAHGAHALYIDGLSIRTETVAAGRGHRPWVPDRIRVELAPQSSRDGTDDANRQPDENPGR
jgi:hypothetical protein